MYFSLWPISLVGFFNSVMFPTIFSLILYGLDSQTCHDSGLFCLTIVGGAILPVIQGSRADSIGLQISFIMPVICYLYIAYYGSIDSKVRAR